MNDSGIEQSPRRAARIAGLWYAILTLFSIFGTLYAGDRFFVPGDAAATAARILAAEWLYRLGIVSELAGQASFVFVGLAFYNLFRTVDRRQARSLLALVVAAVPIAFLNLVAKFAPLVLYGDPAYARAFDQAQLQSLAMLFLQLQKIGLLGVSVFWGLWLLPLGLLVYRSGYFPRFLGVLLIVNFAAYLVDCLLAFLFPELRAIVSPIMKVLQVIGEVPLLLWLLIRGARNPTEERS